MHAAQWSEPRVLKLWILFIRLHDNKTNPVTLCAIPSSNRATRNPNIQTFIQDAVAGFSIMSQQEKEKKRQLEVQTFTSAH